MGRLVFAGQAVAVEELCGLQLVVVLGVGVLAFYGFHEEAGDGFAVVGESAYVSL